MPPALSASPSSTSRSQPPASADATTAAGVATSSHSMSGCPAPRRRPTARRTCSRTVTSSLYRRMRGARGETLVSPCVVVTVVVIVVTVAFVVPAGGSRRGARQHLTRARPDWHLGTSDPVPSPLRAHLPPTGARAGTKGPGPRTGTAGFMALRSDPSPSAGLRGKIWRHCEIHRLRAAVCVPQRGRSSAIMAPVSTATAAPHAHQHVSVNRPNPVSVGTIVWLASELMFFAGLFAMYFTVRAVMPAEEWALQADKL